MFCLACSWNRYSLPRRRAGSPVQDSLGPRMREGDAGPAEHAAPWPGHPCGPARRGRRRSRPSRGTRRRRGSCRRRPGTSKSSACDPVGALGRPEAPRVALVLDVAQHEPGLGRELGLHQHLVAAHVDDGVDVLDVHRALLDAGTAGGARPQHVGVDDRGRCPPGSSTSTPAARLCCMIRSAVGEHVVAQVHDHELGRQRLARVPGRALGLAPAALGAGGHVQELLPGEVLDPARTEDDLVLVADVLHRHVRGRGQGAQRPGAPGGGHVDGGEEDVEVLGVGHEDQEAHDDGDVDQQQHRLQDAVDPGPERAQRPWPRPWEAKAHQP